MATVAAETVPISHKQVLVVFSGLVLKENARAITLVTSDHNV